MITVKQAYLKCREILREAEIENEAFDALCLFKKATGLDRLGIISHGEEALSDEKYKYLMEITRKRTDREPLQYIIGRWSFCGFDFYVGRGVLIPRDDTEVVVNLCLDFTTNSHAKKALDLCAGSGAICIALSKLADIDVTAVELSDEAFKFLKKNIAHNNAKVKPVKGDIFKCHTDFEDGTFDLVVSNPPYIKSDEIPALQEEVRREPSLALDGGVSGYDFYEAIIHNWSSKLVSGGALAFELGEGQFDYVECLMKQNGFCNIKTALDLGGVQRAIIGTKL